ncbi:hypothetical protein [Nocardia paucivorans]|uniref:hypothetical protein n=1 Tax=Nocardia paucivorans TaxID=114259 RepID=UPI0002E82423|nr:hypothetical protein [Nocardia paucivorans]
MLALRATLTTTVVKRDITRLIAMLRPAITLVVQSLGFIHQYFTRAAVADVSEQRFAILGRLGSHGAIVVAVLFLAGELARFVTGVHLDTDGGIPR